MTRNKKQGTSFFRPTIPLAVFWLLIISFLFMLPGSAIPKQGWLDGLHVDKWVHFGFFAILCFLWAGALKLQSRNTLLLLFITAVLYGSLVEFVQHNFIENRSFDGWDLLFDTLGAIAGLWFWRYIKK